MAIKCLKPFQEQAIASAVALFDHARILLDAAATDATSLATAIHDNGYLLIEAPTGSGKTLMAGHIVEQISNRDRVVWFWFAPFKGVVDQSAAFLREQFQGLRLRTLSQDRSDIGSRPGDVFVTTWQLVATRIKDRRSVRQSGEQNPSIDDLILSLRDQGFRIGVVIDEAHHGFHADTQAALFFRTILKPEYTLLITATPDDADLLDLQEHMQIAQLHRISISRADAVGPGPEAGLIKSGIKAIAWRTEDGSDALVDFQTTALRDATALHKILKSELAAQNIPLTPLLLVQVDSKSKSVETAKEKLLELGFAESQIATHTADEPDAGLLAIANDESREVLIFKMAVALGFDAPRAFALVSMRAAHDADFGVQLVGRILRTHRRLQGKVLPESLKYGYVLLADIDAQPGLDAAGQRINRIQTAYATISPTTVIVRVNNQTLVQSSPDGQTTFLPTPSAGAIYQPPPGTDLSSLPSSDGTQSLLFATVNAPEEARESIRALIAAPPPSGYLYPLRSDVPKRFKTQELPDDVDVTEDEVADHFIASAEQLWAALVDSDRVRVQKLTLDIFTGGIQYDLGFAPPSPDQLQRSAQRILIEEKFFNPRQLRQSLLTRLHATLSSKGVHDADDAAKLNHYFNALLTRHPELLRKASKAAFATKMAILDAGALPPHIVSESPLRTSRHNVYHVLPPQLNTWESDFASFLDADSTGSVLFWHRNPPNKPESINVLLESGRGFFPDFIIGIKDRPKPDNALLTDTKYAFSTVDEFPKLLADHASYGRVLIITRDSANRWAIAHANPTTGAAHVGEPFRLSSAHQY